MSDTEDLNATILEQAELRKKLEESVAEAQSQRAESVPETAEEEAPAELPQGREYRVPVEARASKDSSHSRVGLRLVLFCVAVFVVYWLVKTVSLLLFSPTLQTVAPVVPRGPIEAGQAVTLGAYVANTSRMDGAAFVVLAFASGEEVEGPTVRIKGRDTAFVPVHVRLPRGEHVYTMVIFDSWRGVRRLETLRGLTIGARAVEIEVVDVKMPADVSSGPTLTELTGKNPGRSPETVTPVVQVRGPRGIVAEYIGDKTVIPANGSRPMRVSFNANGLPAGQYFAEVAVRSVSGETLGQLRYPIPIEVKR